MSVILGVHQSGFTLIIHGVNVLTIFDKHFYNFLMVFQNLVLPYWEACFLLVEGNMFGLSHTRLHQHIRVFSSGLFCIDICALFNQELGHLHISALGSMHQCSMTPLVKGI